MIVSFLVFNQGHIDYPMGIHSSQYGTDSGQNCVDMDGAYAGDSLIFGTTGTGGGFGAIESSNVFTVNYTPASDFALLAI